MQATHRAAPSKRRMAETQEIYLSVDADGKIVVDPYYAIYHVGDELVWVTDEEAPWAIGFHGKRTPTDSLVIHGNGKQMVGRHTAERQGHFSYSVALQRHNHPLMKGKPTIFLDATCPEIIID